MFKHACKEKFKKFDVNGDGVLEFDEVKNLTNSLYDEFGLQPPPEGALRAFFCATDENQDGVLSEREFRKFFEMFLRYAFFDHLKLRQMVEHGQALEAKRGSSNGKSLKRQTTDVWELCTDGKDSRASSASTAEKPPETLVSEPSPMSRSQSTPALQESGHGKRRDRHRDETNRDDRQRSRPDRNQERERGQSDAFGKTIRCLAPSGVAYRSSAAFQDKTDGVIGKGETVRVLEHWVRTSHGWLPMSDAQGTVLFERSAADQEEGARRPSSGQVYAVKKKVHISTTNNDTLEAVRNTPKHSNTVVNDVGGDLLPNEEEWRPVFERLCERFPNLGADKVAQALRDNEGHAGKAASMLRYM
jgi:Ca2+-binding EF-hand superfamily protein